MKKEQLIKLSPYPVIIKHNFGYYGVLRWGDGTFGKPYTRPYKPRIEMGEDLSDIEYQATLIHEIGHAIHHKKHCKCFTEQDNNKRWYLSELHAVRYALQFMIKHEMINALRFEYGLIKGGMFGCQEYYQKMCVKIKKEKLWQEIKRALDIGDKI